ncbi:MAG: hypothetical protein A3C38_08210 [Planctomycetes bacterium RIFCSPHIGHO2_02_FULL_50_42]|nr:MAG: hypothetical protein A3C38_08210 [Planctomycetes bacterium RIFCSPHIGHO2_02_FULL_50_42]OHB91388.1 MAG: hypothetical protein A3E75_04810 [Planctomycetes bacterium RIFCSPHIGHO2_12_FULL_51_37]OHB95502.1 MAG: hypothetical protein A3I59_07705 [Planctomycetes bacterium RIFCSPLOWO2_02_FULL_50_16]OHC05151.1 MAG: hypothetical protein A3G17_02720 [Planctomycetes bacterium RIFCSPLOWO2_12_FULL_50_35]HCN18834.1 HIT family protein [Planctomycetia bacterium]
MKDCVFCKIAQGKLPATKLLEDKNAISFLDINPVNHGHVLVMPREHYETIMDVPGKEFGKVMEMVPSLAKAVAEVTKADGLNIFQTNKPCAGQTVPHVHFHIIPRHKDDGFHFGWRQGRYNEGEIDRMQWGILKALG